MFICKRGGAHTVHTQDPHVPRNLQAKCYINRVVGSGTKSGTVVTWADKGSFIIRLWYVQLVLQRAHPLYWPVVFEEKLVDKLWYCKWVHSFYTVVLYNEGLSAFVIPSFLACAITSPPTLRASLSSTFLQPLPELVTPLKGRSLSLRSCPLTLSAPSEGLATNKTVEAAQRPSTHVNMRHDHLE